MRRVFAIALAAGAALLAGCAAQRQVPIGLDQGAIGAGAGRIGIVMTPLPPRDTDVPGAACLLCLAFAVQSNSAITEHAKRLDVEDIARLKNEVAAALRKAGSDVVVIDEPLLLDTLPDHNGSGTNVAPKSYTAFKQRHQIDRLLVLNVTHVGFVRTYSSYVPTSDPKGSFRAVGYMVNLATNSYDWYHPVDISQAGDEKWDDPPRYPGLTNAYYQAIEMGKDSLLKAIAVPTNAVRTRAAVGPSMVPATAQGTSASAQPPAAAAAVPTVAPKLVRLQPNSGRKPQAGDEWEYLASDRLFGKQKKLVWRVKGVESGGVVEELLVDGTLSYDGLFNGQPQAIGAPIEMGFVFGPHWDSQVGVPELMVKGQVGDCVRSTPCAIEGKVTGLERITIAAGTFDAVRFDGSIILTHLAIKPRGQISIWYSGRDRRLLKQVASMRNSARVFDETLELQAARTYQ